MSSAGDKSTATEASRGAVVEEGFREMAKENSGDDEGEEHGGDGDDSDEDENIVADVGECCCDCGTPFLAFRFSITSDILLEILAGSLWIY